MRGVHLVRNVRYAVCARLQSIRKTLCPPILQALQDAQPAFHQRLLLGPLGPETLANHHCLSEEGCLALYSLLHTHCGGFQAEAAALLDSQHVAHREQLLAALWRGFAQLWDDSVRVGGCGWAWCHITQQ